MYQSRTTLQIVFPMFINLMKIVGTGILLCALVRFSMETLASLSLVLFLMSMYIIVVSGNLYVLAFVHFINIVLFVLSCTGIFSCFTFIFFFMLGVYLIIGYSYSQKPNNEAFFVFYCLLMLILTGGIIEYATITDLNWAAVIGGFSTSSFLMGAMSRFRLKSSLTEEELKIIAAAKQAEADAKVAAAVAKQAMIDAKNAKEKALIDAKNAAKNEAKNETKKDATMEEKKEVKIEEKKEEQVSKVREVKIFITRATQTPPGGVGEETFQGFRDSRIFTSTPKDIKSYDYLNVP